jgi:GNAT superfamily N-acetyltransferase
LNCRIAGSIVVYTITNTAFFVKVLKVANTYFLKYNILMERNNFFDLQEGGSKSNLNLSFVIFLKQFLYKHRASLYFNAEGGKITTPGMRFPFTTDSIFKSPTIYEGVYISKNGDKGILKCTLYSAKDKLNQTYTDPDGRYQRNIYVRTQRVEFLAVLKMEMLENVTSTIRFEIYPDRIEIDEFLFRSLYSKTFKGMGIGSQLMHIFKDLANFYNLPLSLTSTPDSKRFYTKEGFVEEIIEGKIKTKYYPSA